MTPRTVVVAAQQAARQPRAVPIRVGPAARGGGTRLAPARSFTLSLRNPPLFETRTSES